MSQPSPRIAPVGREPREVVLVRAANRVRWLGVGAMGLLTVMALRGAWLCTNPQEAIVERGEVQRFDARPIQGKRGDILDRNGRVLATSVDMPSVIADPFWIAPEERGALAAKLGEILGVDAQALEARIARGGRYVRVATKTHPDKVRAIRALKHKGLSIEENALRYYPDKGLASQVVGFVDSDGEGREGLEAYLNRELKGDLLMVQRRRDRMGYAVDLPVDADARAFAGQRVYTTLDRSLQRITERALEKVMVAHEPASATAIVVDVKTGDILALANTPGFNPNKVDGDAAARKNHAVQDAIEPGSTYKPFTVSIAVEEGLVTETSRIDCEGGFWAVGRSRVRDDHPHGVVTVSEVIKYSSNIGSGKLAMMVGAEKFIRYLQDFGFAARTGVFLPGERRGVLRNPRSIKSIELVTTAFGQGTTVTPLQMVMGIAAIANDGLRMKPRLVTRTEDAYGIPEEIHPPTPVKQVVSRETAEAVTRMMVTVTEPGGTATRAVVPGYLVAGKTGTAQKVKDGVYSPARIGSFVGFIPADDPVLAVMVVVDEPTKGSKYGGIVAAPAFAEIAGQAMRELGIPPNPELLKKPLPTLPVEPWPEAPPLELAWAGHGWVLPDLTGRPFREVLAALQGSGIRLELEGGGHVVAQQPAAGIAMAPGQTLRVVLRE